MDYKAGSDRIEVSVYCPVYNQARYVRRCLDSLVNQKTTFRYEIVVHDDASTDGTKEIVLDYAREYPEIIVPVLEKQNIYSQGISIRSAVAPHIRGKYVAVCEGDDWWTDLNKIQIQWEYMEAHPDCSLCVHEVEKYEATGDKKCGKMAPSDCERDFKTEDMILGDGNMVGTNSMFYKAEHFMLPDCYLGWGVMDYPSCIYLSTVGKVHYQHRSMSAYRVSSAGSWSETMKDDDRRLRYLKAIINGLEAFNSETNQQYGAAVQDKIGQYQIEVAVITGDLDSLLKGELRDAFKKLPLFTRVKKIMKLKFPRLRRLKTAA